MVFRGAFFLLVLAAAAPVHAMDWGFDETKSSLRLSLETDVFRVPGTTVATLRYGGGWNAKASVWLVDAGVKPDAPHFLLGAGYVFTVKKVRLGAGVVWIDSENEANGTRWNFDGSVGYDLTDRWFLEYQHYSHGAILGLSHGTSNGGWNFVGLGYIF